MKKQEETKHNGLKKRIVIMVFIIISLLFFLGMLAYGAWANYDSVVKKIEYKYFDEGYIPNIGKYFSSTYYRNTARNVGVDTGYPIYCSSWDIGAGSHEFSSFPYTGMDRWILEEATIYVYLGGVNWSNVPEYEYGHEGEDGVEPWDSTTKAQSSWADVGLNKTVDTGYLRDEDDEVISGSGWKTNDHFYNSKSGWAELATFGDGNSIYNLKDIKFFLHIANGDTAAGHAWWNEIIDFALEGYNEDTGEWEYVTEFRYSAPQYGVNTGYGGFGRGCIVTDYSSRSVDYSKNYSQFKVWYAYSGGKVLNVSCLNVALYGDVSCNHKYIQKQVMSTCTEGGYTLYTCSRCGDSYKDNYTNPLGHSISGTYVYGSNNNISNGTRYKCCLRCGIELLREYKGILNHYLWNPVSGTWNFWTSSENYYVVGTQVTPAYLAPPAGYAAHSIDYPYTISCAVTKNAYYNTNSYILYFNGNGGTVNPAKKNVEYKNYYGTLPNPVREYCQFAGWYLTPHLFKNSDEVSYANDKITADSIYDIAGNSVIYAGWVDVGVPKIVIEPVKPEDEDFDGTWKKKPIEMDINASDAGFSNLVYFSLKCETNGDVIFEENYGEPVPSVSKHVVIGNRDTKEYEGVYDWIITARDSSGNVSTTTFKTKLDFTPPVIMDIAGEYDDNGQLVTQTVQKYRDSDDMIEQTASDENPNVNEVSGIRYFCLYLSSNQNTFINQKITPYISSAPFEIKYDFIENTNEEELGVILYAIDVAGNSTSRLVTPEAGINHMIRRTVPRNNYD